MMQIISCYEKLINEVDNKKPNFYSTSNSFSSKKWLKIREIL
jgi:hypothetical protein